MSTKKSQNNKKSQNIKKVLTDNIMRRIMFAESHETQAKKKEGERKVIEKEKQIIENFAVVIPKLSEEDKSYLLGLGEGMAMQISKEEKEKNEKK